MATPRLGLVVEDKSTELSCILLTILASIWRSRTLLGDEITSAEKVHERESILKSAVIP